MIYKYEIRKIGEQEKLFLYLDLNYEFANLDFKTKKRSLEQAINEFILKNKIVFKGSVISLIVGGVLVGDLIFKQPNFSNKVGLIDEITPKIIEVDRLMKIPELPKIDEIEIIDVEDNNSNNLNILTKENDIKNEIFKDATTNNKSNEINSSYNNINTNDVKVIENRLENSKIDNNTYVTIHRANGDIETLELEEYLVGVVGAEMPALFQKEALKAQAVVARTYTLKSLSIGKSLTDTESTQSYKNRMELKKLWGNNYDTYISKIENAVFETKGIYLSYNGSYIEAVYHSTSNGKTENAFNVWKNSYPYLVSVASPYDLDNPSFLHEIIISYQTLTNKLGLVVNSDSTFEILGYTSGDRVSDISIDGKIFKGIDFRNLLGLRSTDFEIIKESQGVKIKTKGYGHGVGMSQYGANGMAKNGSSFKDILKHYYQGVSIKQK